MPYGLASFRSRQQVFAFESVIKRAGLKANVMSTPREVALGCGLSVQFDLHEADRVLDLYRRAKPSNLIGFYHVDDQPGRRPVLTPLTM